jgi:hypothetical protein
MVVVVAKGHSGERKKREDCTEKNWGRGWFFILFLDPNFPSLRPSNPPIFIGSGKDNIFYTGEKLQPLIQMGRIPTVGSK